MTVVALPLFKLELSFSVRKGRRWTALEHLLLWSLSEAPQTLDDLRRQTDMPTRLVVEALVNLLKVGWIEMTTLGRDSRFAVLFTANARGRGVVDEEDLPYAFEMERRFAALYVERLTGHVLREDVLQIRHWEQIDGTKVAFLRPNQDKYAANPAYFYAGLKLRPEDRFERLIDHRVTSLAHYAMLEVMGEHVSGLSDDVPAQLLEGILRNMPPSHWKSDVAVDTSVERSSRPLTSQSRFVSADVREGDLLIGGREHKDEFRRMLRDAKRNVIVHSTFVGRSMENFLDDLSGAAARKVEIALLWGERQVRPDSDLNRSEVAGRLAHSKIPAEHRERIRLPRDPTGSHVKVILADSGPGGTYEAVVGSCNWLSATYMNLEMSVRLREPSLVGEVAGLLANLSRPPSGAWGREVTTLMKIQDDCRVAALGQPDPGERGTMAMLVIDDEHYVAVRDVRNASARKVTVGCDLFGHAARTTVFEPLGAAARDDETSVEVMFNQATDAFEHELDAAVRELSGPTVRIARCPGLHGKFLGWNDETLVVTSFNWLSASTRPDRLSVDELGILIRDPVLVPKLQNRIRRWARTEQTQLVP